jgi:UDP-glucose 4-epimerase
MKQILVIGGAGYIGSHMVSLLLAQGCRVVVYDNLSTGHPWALDKQCLFVKGDLADKTALQHLFQAHSFDAVMHFASFIEVGESVKNPRKYYQNNLVNTINLLDTLLDFNVHAFIFSSTAAIFGNPHYTPIDEQHPTQPLNAYGRSKLMVENILADYAASYPLRSVSLRYFNAAGAHPDKMLGEAHSPETHLIPLTLQAASGRRPNITIYGTDYDTRDGTCLRDYIHVCDLCQAHWLALQYLWETQKSEAFNLGNGTGYSVKQIIETAGKITGTKIPTLIAERRAGDAKSLIADASKAREILKWAPQYSQLETIIEHAWRWEQHLLTQKTNA